VLKINAACICLLVCSLPGAFSHDITLEALLAKWNEKSRKVNSVACRIDFDWWIPKESLKADDGKRLPEADFTHRGYAEHLVDFSTGKYRIVREKKLFNVESGAFYDNLDCTFGNGRNSYAWEMNEFVKKTSKGYRNFTEGPPAINPFDPLEFPTLLSLQPFLAENPDNAHRTTLRLDPSTSASLLPSDSEGLQVLEVRARTNKVRDVRMWIDPNKDHTIVKWEVQSNGKPIRSISINHKLVDGMYLPDSGTIYLFYPNDSSRPRYKVTYTVKWLKINPEIDHSVFEPDFRPGEFISRYRPETQGDTHTRLDSDLKEHPWEPNTGADYTVVNRQMWIIAACLLIGGAIIAAFLWYRKKLAS
jgi:hypothetical protein